MVPPIPSRAKGEGPLIFRGRVLPAISPAARTGVAVLVNAILALFTLASCHKPESNVEKGNRLQILHRGNGQEVQDLDPQLANSTGEFNILSALLEGLVGEDPQDLHPVPGVAEAWDVSDDGRTYTFHLRANAKWSNGDVVTARDFIESYRRILSPALAADNAYMLYAVENAEAFHKSKITDFNQVGFAAPDDRTLVVKLTSPTPYFLSLLSGYSWFPVHIPTVQKYGPAFERGSRWTRPGRFVGNGPFTLEDWRLNVDVRVKKNPLYWDAANVTLNGIVFHTIDSLNVEERAFRAGQIHLSDAIPINRIDRYRREQPDLLRIDPYLGTYFYRVNVTKPPLTDRFVRRALGMAIDRESIVANVTRGAQLPAGSFTPPNTGGYTPTASLTFDVPGAQRALAEAGFPEGRGLPPIEILFDTSENHRTIAEAIQQMWRKNLNVNATLVNQEQKVYFNSRRQMDYQMVRSSWIGDYNDPNSFLNLWVSGAGNNMTGWSNPAYDGLITAASETADQGARFAAFQQAERLLLEEAPIIPIYFYTHCFLLRPSVKGWYPTILDHHPYKHVRLE